MRSLTYLSVFCLCFVVHSLTAQGDSFYRSDANWLDQQPTTKASLMAASDKNIQEYQDSETGEYYYIRTWNNPWNGIHRYELVVFDNNRDVFIKASLASASEASLETLETLSLHQTQTARPDSTNLPKRPIPVRPATPLKRKHPHRSSRVKIIARF